jgi:superfamily II DNA/RNA helicase
MESLKHWQNEFKVITVYGGTPISDQIRELKYGVDIFVGTTGRVLDHIERGNIDFSNLRCIVLDEADQMLKLGFREDIENVSHQNFLTSHRSSPRSSSETRTTFKSASSQLPSLIGCRTSPVCI